MLSATVVSVSCHLLPNEIITDVFEEKQHVTACCWDADYSGCSADRMWKEFGKKSHELQQIVFSGVEEAVATFPKNQGRSFFVQTMQIRVFVPHWWQMKEGREGSERLLSMQLCDS